MGEFPAELGARVERLLSTSIVSARAAPRGYSAAGRWRVTLGSGAAVFVKLGTTDGTAGALRLESQVYRELHAPFMPELLAWEDHPFQPVLVLEDLGPAYWPPPWNAELVNEVRTTLEALHRSSAKLKTFVELHGDIGADWQVVANDPEPFLKLGLATPVWLERALPQLIQASAKVSGEGEDVVHLDVRSDNLCKAARGVVLIDWNWACLGNGALDTGFWLPSLEAEGGPQPETILQGRPDIAACVSGFFAARAGGPPISEAPHVRSVQLQQLRPALRWAARELGLPAPLALP